MSGSKNVSTDLKSKIVELVRAGMTPSYVAVSYSFSRNTVKSTIRRSKQVTTTSILTIPGRKHKLGPRCVRRLLNHVRNNNRQPLFVDAAHLCKLDGAKLSQ